MKNLILSIAALFCAAHMSAQDIATRDGQAPKHFPAMAAAEADDHGIISQQPEGEVQYYLRAGGATYASYYFMKETQDGMATEFVYAEDGKVYIKNIISHAATGTWVEGTIDGNTLTVPLGQTIYWWDNDGNGGGNYGLKLARVQVNGTIESYTSSTQGSVTFTIDGDKLSLQGTRATPDENIFDGLGLVYSGPGIEEADEWSYYLDYETVFTRKEVTPATPPANLETEVYSIEHDNTGHFVRVGFDGSDVYIQGISESRVADAWIKGTLKGNQITFPLQYAGIYSTYMLFFNAAYGEYMKGSDGYWDWYYSWTDGSITFAYDPKTRIFQSDMSMMVTNSDTEMGRGEIFHAPVFRPYKERAATPADPAITYHQDMGAFTILMLNVPLQDTDGNFMDPSKVSFQLFLSDDEPFVFYPDEYKYLTKELDEVPYLFTDETREAYSRSYIYEKASYIYLFQKGLDQLGIQSIYRGGGEEHRSKIVYRDMTGISGVATEEATTTANYDLSGRTVTSQHKGLTISRMSDGRVIKRILR